MAGNNSSQELRLAMRYSCKLFKQRIEKLENDIDAVVRTYHNCNYADKQARKKEFSSKVAKLQAYRGDWLTLLLWLYRVQESLGELPYSDKWWEKVTEENWHRSVELKKYMSGPFTPLDMSEYLVN